MSTGTGKAQGTKPGGEDPAPHCAMSQSLAEAVGQLLGPGALQRGPHHQARLCPGGRPSPPPTPRPAAQGQEPPATRSGRAGGTFPSVPGAPSQARPVRSSSVPGGPPPRADGWEEGRHPRAHLRAELQGADGMPTGAAAEEGQPVCPRPCPLFPLYLAARASQQPPLPGLRLDREEL